MRLIDTDALIKQMDEKGFSMASRKTINDAPTVDAEPISHGEWISVFSGDGYDFIGSACSACDVIQENGSKGMNYCPNCGAKMDGKYD